MPRAHAVDCFAVAKVFELGVISELVCQLKPQLWAGDIADIVYVFEHFKVGPDGALEFIERKYAKDAVVYCQARWPDRLGLFRHSMSLIKILKYTPMFSWSY